MLPLDDVENYDYSTIEPSLPPVQQGKKRKASTPSCAVKAYDDTQLIMRSTHHLSRRNNIYVGIDKSFKIFIRLGEKLNINEDTFNVFTETCRNVFDIRYDAQLEPLKCNNLTVTPEFNSKNRIFPSAISVSNNLEGQCILDREAFLRIVDLTPAIRFKVRILTELSPYVVYRNMKCAYIKSEFYCKNGAIKPFINDYLTKIPLLHAQFLSEFRSYFPIKMYNSLTNAVAQINEY